MLRLCVTFSGSSTQMTDAAARVCSPRPVPASVSFFQRGMSLEVNGCNTAWGATAASRNLANFSSLRAVGDVGTCLPLGVERLEMVDGGRKIGGVLLFGGLAAGVLKLRTHREAVSRRFEGNDQVWDAEETLALACGLYD